MQKRLRDRLNRQRLAGLALLAALFAMTVLLAPDIIPNGAPRSVAHSAVGIAATVSAGSTSIVAARNRTTRGAGGTTTTGAGRTKTTGRARTTSTGGAHRTKRSGAPLTTTTGAPETTTTGAPQPTTTTGPPRTPTTTTAPPTTTTTQPPPSGPQPAGDASGPWTMVFDSTFTGSSLPSQWTTGWFGKGITVGTSDTDQECYDPSEVSLTGGVLELRAVKEPVSCGGSTHPYASGMVTTNPTTDPGGGYQFTYGYMQASIWLPPTAGGAIADWPAFWADGQNWPADGEIDVLEGLGGQACAHFHDPAGAEGTCAPGAFAGGWHTFGANWEPGSVTYYYDGVKVWTDTSGITSVPMYLILNLAIAPGQPAAAASMGVAYVRVWQH